MKATRFRIISRIAATGIALVAAGAILMPAQVGAEKVRSYDVFLDVLTDGSFDVTERIEYDFEGADRHGIYRDIPIQYRTKLGFSVLIDLYDLTVTDGVGTPQPFTVSRDGDWKQIRIGDPSASISGVRSYEISYKVKYGIGYFEHTDEVYWNAIGTGWNIPMEHVSASIRLPEGIQAQVVRTACYVGRFGDMSSCGGSVSTESDGATVASFDGGSLMENEAFTIVIGFPKGFVREPGFFERFFNRFIATHAYVFLIPVVILFFSYRKWKKEGEDPEGSGVVIPEYDVADDLSPMEVATLVAKKNISKSIVAEIVLLAQRGYIRIRREDRETFLFTNADYVLEGLKGPDDSLKPHQVELLNGLFSSFPSEVKLSDLKKDFYGKVDAVREKARDAVQKAGYYDGDMHKGTRMFAFGIICGIIGIATMRSSLAVALSMLISTTILFVFSLLMPRMSEKGVRTVDRLKGLKLYLSVAEKHRIDFHSAPRKDPKTFERFLPYAIAFGVEKRWAKEFENLHMSAPDWYGDRNIRDFDSTTLAASVSGFFSAFTAFEKAVAPGSHSGLGGGGFSGGGGGGGGGGSW